MQETKHTSVLLQETVDGLFLKSGSVVVDATLGGGGHTRELLRRVLPSGTVIALDTDRSALDMFQKSIVPGDIVYQALQDGHLLLVQSNYSAIDEVLEKHHIEHVDAILADLGFSSDQIEAPERGLSFMLDGPLDMRLNRDTDLTAEKIVNTFSQEEIEKILRDFGEETESRRITRMIVSEREKKMFTTTSELRMLIENVYPKSKRFKMKIHPATKTFQALRIAVNQELYHLEQFLKQAEKRLKKGGRIAVITFHSGEDRVVKQFWKERASGCICPPGFPVCRCGKMPQIKILTKKPLLPTEEEKKKNVRARSAKLRIAEKI